MTISFRIDSRAAIMLDRLTKESGRSKSDIIRDSLDEYLQRHVTKPTPYELAKPYLGCVDSGRDDLGSNHSRILKEKLRAKTRRH